MIKNINFFISFYCYGLCPYECKSFAQVGNRSNAEYYHGTYIRWQIRNMCACEEKSLLFDLFQAIDQIESSRFFVHACAKLSELPSNIRTMEYYRQGEYNRGASIKSNLKNNID